MMRCRKERFEGAEKPVKFSELPTKWKRTIVLLLCSTALSLALLILLVAAQAGSLLHVMIG